MDGAARLSDLLPGRRAVVLEVAGARGVTGRLLALGLVPGRRVLVLENDGRGPVILASGSDSTRLAVGRRLAGRIRLRGGGRP